MLKSVGALALMLGWLACAESVRAESVAERFPGGMRLAVTRSIDADGEPTERKISLEDWLAYVAKVPNLRIRTEPRTAAGLVPESRRRSGLRAVEAVACHFEAVITDVYDGEIVEW